jgi:hypothetical protein
VTRWTATIDGVTYTGRPLSAEAVRRFYDALTAAPEAEHAALVFGLVRKVFPLSWRRIWWADPARKVTRSPLCNAILAGWLKVPAPAPVKTREPDEWDKLEQAQRVEDDPGGHRITLDTVCRLTEVVMGAGWYYNPERWATWDGYAPYEVVWDAWYTIQRARAWERLNLVRAVGITKAGERAQALYDSDVREALGG